MVAISLLGCLPVSGAHHSKVVSRRRKLSDGCRTPVKEFLGRNVVSCPPLLKVGVDRSAVQPIKAQAMGLMKERTYKIEERILRDFKYPIDTAGDRKLGLWPPDNKADDPSLHNPLLRLERMGCGWFAAIFEWEGVLIEDNPDLERQAWLSLSQEEGKSPPPAYMLRRIEGVKNEQVISEVLCWSRDSAEVRRMASRKEDIYQVLQGGIYKLQAGSQEFVNALVRNNIPMALVSSRPRKTLESAFGTLGIENAVFAVVVAAEDVYRGKPDPEMFLYAAQLLKFIPERCIVFGNSNQTVEAAREARMKCVAVASKHPVYELGAADLVVKRLDELSVMDLKQLVAVESAEYGSGEPELAMEEEEEEDDEPYPSSSMDVGDDFW